MYYLISESEEKIFGNEVVDINSLERGLLLSNGTTSFQI